MKKIVLLLSTLFAAFSNTNAQNFGAFASAVFISQNNIASGFNITGEGADLIGRPQNPFSGSLGTHQQNSGSLMLNGGEVKTFKTAGANVCGATMFYSIHLAGGTAPFVSYNLPFKAGCVGNVFTDNLGPCNGNDQKWSTETDDIDLTAFPPGDYEMDVYFEMSGSSASETACDETNTIGNDMAAAGTMTFTIISNPLAINLLSFGGKTYNKANVVHWNMGDETNIAMYQLEKSLDGKHFQPITKITADLSLQGRYSFTDASVANEQQLYRLKLTDKNNNVVYSNVITLNDKIHEASVIAMPNPAKDFVLVKSAFAEPAVIGIFDISGKNVRKFNTQSVETKIDISGFSSGVYIVTYKSAHASQIIKISKQ